MSKCKDVDVMELSQTSHVISEAELHRKVPNLGIIIALYYLVLTRDVCS